MTRVVNKLIKTELKEMLYSHDFIQIKPKLFVRVRENLIDVIELGISRFGGMIYLNYFINILPSSVPDSILSGSYLGFKLNRNDKEDRGWVLGKEKDDSDTIDTIVSIKNIIEEEVIPWFDSIKKVEDYIVEKYLILANKFGDELTNFSTEFTFKLIGKDYKHFLTILDGIRSPCFDKEVLYELISKTKDISIDQEWIEKLKKDTLSINKLEKLSYYLVS